MPTNENLRLTARGLAVRCRLHAGKEIGPSCPAIFLSSGRLCPLVICAEVRTEDWLKHLTEKEEDD